MATSRQDILARARIIATGMGIDPNSSALIDNLPALYALLDTAISAVYVKRARDKKNWRDISVKHTVSMSSGSGAIPSELLREFLHQADFADEDNSLISYLTFGIDDRETFSNYLGYVKVVGNNFEYTAPLGASGTYTGDLYVTAPSSPEMPNDSTTDIAMTSEVFDDVCSTLALMIRAEYPLTN